MAAIREEYILADRFSASFTRLLGFLDRTDAASRAAAQSQQRLEQASGGGAAAMVRLAEAALDVAERMGAAGDQAQEMAKATTQAADASERAVMYQERVNASMRRGASAASGLENRLLSLAKAYAGLRTAQQFIGMTDAFTQTNARLDRMNDGRQTTDELRQMAYDAAQRANGDYQGMIDMVSKLGTLAPDTFGSSAEIVAFAEQISKHFMLSGTSAQGAQAAMLQLTQAMSSGVLRGEELNSVLEQAPTITQAIAKYLDVSTGKLREMASQGDVTAGVVKNALFELAEETDRFVGDIPLTFDRAWNTAGSAAVKALEPAMKRLNDLLNSELGQNAVNGLIAGFELLGRVAAGAVDLLAAGAQWVADNWDFVSAVLQFAAGAFLALAAVSVMSAAASAGAWAVAHWPLLLLIAVVGSAVMAMYAMGMTSEEVFAKIGAGAGALYVFGHNLIASGWNLIASFTEFFALAFSGKIEAVAVLFQGLFNFILDIVSTAAGAIDALLGSNISGAIRGFQAKVNSFVGDIAAENGVKVERMEMLDIHATMDQWSQAAGGFGRNLDNFTIPDVLGGYAQSSIDRTNFMANSGIPGKLDEIGNDTAAIKRSVSLAEEDMKLLVDMAERQYVNNINLTAQTPVINVTGQNTGDTEMDRRSLANAIRDIIIEEAASHTDMSYR